LKRLEGFAALRAGIFVGGHDGRKIGGKETVEVCMKASTIQAGAGAQYLSPNR
jgi:delta-aminolevulinic acid dehydratase/porphobilinogen synthase